MSLILEHKEGTVTIEELPDGRKSLSVVPSPGQFIFSTNWTTSYSLDLIKLILEVNGAAGLCFEIMRDEDPQFVQKFLKNDLSAYFSPEDFVGKRILDFGCGTGASTVILSKMFAQSEFTGVEMVDSALSVAKKRVEFYNLPNVSFHQSPNGSDLPEKLGKFDFVILSAVYEHLLPEERKILLPKLWDLVRESGYLFINQTPNRLFPFELHTTMLPLINYVPDFIALKMAHKISKRTTAHETWEELLRKGIRGATEQGILKLLSKDNQNVEMLEPKNNGLKDRIDLYYLNTNSERLQKVKKAAKFFIKAVKSITGLTIIPDLSLAFRKIPQQNSSAK